MKRFYIIFSMVMSSILTLSFVAHAQNDDKDIARVRAELIKMIPVASDSTIVASDVKGIYQVEIQGNFAYAYVSGDHVLIGDLLNTKERINVGDVAQSGRMAELIAEVPDDQMIIFGPENPKRYVTVFTDIDCGYCRKLHNEVPELTAAGIQVRYLAFPRAGIGSDSHKKYVSVWCNNDQQSSLTAAKNGKSVPDASCDNPVSDTYALGQKVGVRGTPTIIFDDGTVTPGYMPSDTLIERLGLKG